MIHVGFFLFSMSNLNKIKSPNRIADRLLLTEGNEILKQLNCDTTRPLGSVKNIFFSYGTEVFSAEASD